MALTNFRPRGDVKINWTSANPILKEREMCIEWETEIGLGQPRIKFGKPGGATHYNDTEYAVLPNRHDTKENWESNNPILENKEIGIEWETTIGEGAVAIKIGNGTTNWNDLDYAVSETLKEIIESSETQPVIAVGDSLPVIAGKLNKQQSDLKTALGYDRLDALVKSLAGLSQQDFVGIMDFINNKKFDKANLYNGTDSTNANLALAAPVGKDLKDQLDLLNTNLQKKADSSQIPTSMAWSKITGTPSTYAPSSHTHDDRYYTESEINTKIAAINCLKPSLSPIMGYFSASDRITHITWDDKSRRIKVMIDRTTWVYIDVSY